MARNVITSERVWDAVRKIVEPREPLSIDQRGNYPTRTYRVWFSNVGSECELVTIPPVPKKKHPKLR